MVKREPSILDLNNDVLVLICNTLHAQLERSPTHIRHRTNLTKLSSLKAFSTTCKRLRKLAAPLVFHSVELGKFEWTWDDVRNGIESMEKCAEVKQHAKRFSMCFYNNHRENEPNPDEALFLKMAAILQSMEKLEKLNFTSLIATEKQLETMESSFEKSPAKFNTVKSLAIPCRLSCLVSKCPNLSHLDIQSPNGQDHNPLDAIAQAKGLQILECKTRWDYKRLRRIRELAPGIHALAMKASLAPYDDSIYDFIPTLASFPKLRTLVLEDISYLEVGFDAPECGNAYMGPGGAALRERVDEDARRLSGEVAEAVFGECGRLEELWIGEGGCSRATYVRDPDGGVGKIEWSEGRRDRD